MSKDKKFNPEADKYSISRKIVRHNKVVQGRQGFTALQQRILLLASSYLQPSDEEFYGQYIKIAEILNKPAGTKISGREYKSVRKAAEDLAESAIKVEREDGTWGSYSLIKSAEGNSNKTDFVYIRFDRDMLPFFLHLKKDYTSYLLEHVNDFKHRYSLRIYELCKQYYPNIKHRKFTIERFKYLLSIESKYAAFSMFKSKVIDPSIEEVNKYSDIYLEVEFLKEKRKYTEIVFKIEYNKSYKARPKINIPLESDVVQQEFIDFEVVETKNATTGTIDFPEPKEDKQHPEWVDNNLYTKLKKKYNEKIIDFVLQHIDEKISEISNPRGYLIKALKEGWFAEEVNKTNKISDNKLKEKQEKENLQKIKLLQENISKAFDQDRAKIMKNWTDNVLDEYTIEEFIFHFEDAESNYMRKVVQKLIEKKAGQSEFNFVIKWFAEEYMQSVDENDLMFIRASKEDIARYSEKYHSHKWVNL